MNSTLFLGFNDHSKLKDMHALMGASKYHWLNYDADKMQQYYLNFKSAERGTKLHEFAHTCIDLGQKLPHSEKTLNMYVNDAIGFRMTPEQVLFYSENCFGTCDAISFRNNKLRIHDLKTGTTVAHIEQLYIYAALFCLEYKIDPRQIEIELRIYQNDSVIYEIPDPQMILDITKKIIDFDKLINNLKEA